MGGGGGGGGHRKKSLRRAVALTPHTFVEQFTGALHDISAKVSHAHHHHHHSHDHHKTRGGGGGVRGSRSHVDQAANQATNHADQLEEQLDNMRAINRKHRLHSKLFTEEAFPLEHQLVKQHASHLPTHIDTLEDYQKWLSVRDTLTEEGRVQFGLLRRVAIDLFNQETVDLAIPIEPPTKAGADEMYVPPNTSNDPYDNAPAPVEIAEAEDTIDEHPFVGQIRDAQALQTDAEREHYRQMALKEADQRQLLMLLCGDIEADVFFDKKGDMRHPTQIIDQILFLLKPYHLSNSKVGAWGQHLKFYANYAWKYGYNVTLLLVSVMAMYHIGQFVVTCVHHIGVTKVYHRVIRWVLNQATAMLVGLFNTVVRLVSKHATVANTGLAWSSATGRKFVKALCVGGPVTALCYFFSECKVDYNSSEQLTYAMYGVRSMYDRYKQLDAMNYLAQLTPGFFGEDMSTGITNGQLGLLCRVQAEFVAIDKRIAELRADEFARLIKSYNETYRGSGITQHKLELGNLLNRVYNTSLSTYEESPEKLRSELLREYPDDVRSFHLLDAYGHPRIPTDICKAYFIYAQRRYQSQVIPTIPYTGGPIEKYFKLTPTEQLKTMRKGMDDKDTSKNVPDEWWRQHPYLYSKNQTKLPLREALLTEPADVLSIFEKGGRNAIRKHEGWTHRIAHLSTEKLVHRFHLSLILLETEYDLVKREERAVYDKVLDLGEGVKGVEWDERRDMMGFAKGRRLSAARGSRRSSRSSETVRNTAKADARAIKSLQKLFVALMYDNLSKNILGKNATITFTKPEFEKTIEKLYKKCM
jgi:hypothetical protein